MRKVIFRLLALICLVASPLVGAQNVIEDQGVGMTREELEHWIQLWTPQMKAAAAIDRGDRIELLNMALASKKIAAEAESATPEPDPDAYWEMQFSIRNIQRNYVTRQYMSNLQVPDMKGLARERYITEKDKYAFVPERRMSSHILFGCEVGACNVEKTKETMALAKEVLEQLRGGADFEEIVTQYSQDPGSKNTGGKFDRWLRLGEPNVTPPYVGALFEIEKVGDYSEVTSTQFGFHIIRLDGIEESYYKSYEDVESRIVDTMVHEYKVLAAKEFDARYQLTEEARLDDRALDEIFAPYQPDTLPVAAPAEQEKAAPGQAAAPEAGS